MQLTGQSTWSYEVSIVVFTPGKLPHGNSQERHQLAARGSPGAMACICFAAKGASMVDGNGPWTRRSGEMAFVVVVLATTLVLEPNPPEIDLVAVAVMNKRREGER